MKYRQYGRIFWSLLVTAILIDSTVDFLAFRQSYETDQTGQAIAQSYNIRNILGDLTSSLRDFKDAQIQNDKYAEAAVLSSIREHYRELLTAIRQDELQSKRFSNFSFLSSSEPENSILDQLKKSAYALEMAARDARLAEQRQLQVKLADDQSANNTSKNEIIMASLIDLLLMLAAALLWRNYDLSRRTNEKIMTDAIANTEEANAELRTVLDQKTQELRTTVHDLKNPLGSIKGFSELLSEESDHSSVVEMSQSLRRLSEHSLELVNSLLNVEAQSLSMSQQPINVIDCIDEVRAALRPETIRKRQSIHWLSSLQSANVNGDPKKIWDVFMNLIGNAVKYSPYDSNIYVKARSQDHFLVVEIEDEGPGFTADDKKHAFNPFQKLSAKPTGGETSSGLGLNICHQIIRSYKGRLEISDKASGQGARMIVYLPLQKDNTNGVHGHHSEMNL